MYHFYSGCWGFSLLLPPKRRRWAGIHVDPPRAPQHLEGRHCALTCPPWGHAVRWGWAGGHEGGMSPPGLEGPFWRSCQGALCLTPAARGLGPGPSRRAVIKVISGVYEAPGCIMGLESSVSITDCIFFFHTKFGLCTVTYCGLSACWVRPEERAALQGTHGGGWGKISLSLLWFLNPNRFREQNEPQNKQQDLLYGRNCGQKERQQSPELCTGTQLLSFRQLLWYWCPDQCCWAGQSSFNWSAQDTACFCTTVGKTQLFVCLCTWRSAVPRADVRVMLLPWPRKLRWLLYVPVSGASCH